jgi:hypothetical protein
LLLFNSSIRCFIDILDIREDADSGRGSGSPPSRTMAERSWMKAIRGACL